MKLDLTGLHIEVTEAIREFTERKIKKLDTIPKNDTVFIINEKQILINDNGMLMYYNVNDKKSYKIEHLENSFVNFFFKDGILSIFTQNEITNYKIILP